MTRSFALCNDQNPSAVCTADAAYFQAADDGGSVVVLVTGAAGFIGHRLCERFVDDPNIDLVLGVDCFTEFYDVAINLSRINRHRQADRRKKFRFVKLDICDETSLKALLDLYPPKAIFQLAAQVCHHCKLLCI